MSDILNKIILLSAIDSFYRDDPEFSVIYNEIKELVENNEYMSAKDREEIEDNKTQHKEIK